MSNPKGYGNLNSKEQAKYKLLINKSDLTEKEEHSLSYYKKKIELYLNPPTLSVSAKNHLIEIYSRHKYGLRNAKLNDFARLTQLKGFALEKEGLELLSKIDNVNYVKPTEIVSDDYLIGICDILHPNNEKILEIKTSWNAANFMKNRAENYKLPNNIYAQIQGYLHLYNIKEAEVCYVLVNTPPHLIEQEYANVFKKYTFGEITREKYDEDCYKLEGFFDYNKIPEKKRVIRFKIQYSPIYIERVKSRVEMARNFLNDFEKRFLSNSIIHLDNEMYLRNIELESEKEEQEPEL
jgi:hypothetical protein